MTERSPHWFVSHGLPLALFWFFYFAGQGIFFPYYPLYLRENAGLSGTQVGIVLAMLPLMGIFAQPFCRERRLVPGWPSAQPSR